MELHDEESSHHYHQQQQFESSNNLRLRIHTEKEFNINIIQIQSWILSTIVMVSKLWMSIRYWHVEIIICLGS
ncbi:hypothetical protein DERF_006300 [Dermatophagoides farinae]|uniref:Uncharacterized protein n=1 Tax=Dermatophagoides farinae TaxID=6954 RepID=A0A922IBB9_DERFA|nr:hypothetical protein DERF_006300 [Dermatophagoides farinae]